jgi:hypothetical protein
MRPRGDFKQALFWSAAGLSGALALLVGVTPSLATDLTAAAGIRANRPVTAQVAPTSWASLNAAIARIPSYRSGWARWALQNSDVCATADWHQGVIYVSPTTPQTKLYDVVVHEWSHILQVRAYDGDVEATNASLNKYFGGSGNLGAEYAADCMAILQGATWTHYTDCSNERWVAGARDLLAGNRVP